jgi:hypothetical protein
MRRADATGDACEGQRMMRDRGRRDGGDAMRAMRCDKGRRVKKGQTGGRGRQRMKRKRKKKRTSVRLAFMSRRRARQARVKNGEQPALVFASERGFHISAERNELAVHSVAVNAGSKLDRACLPRGASRLPRVLHRHTRSAAALCSSSTVVMTKTVFCEFTSACWRCCLAGNPTRRLPCLMNVTTEGVVRAPGRGLRH